MLKMIILWRFIGSWRRLEIQEVLNLQNQSLNFCLVALCSTITVTHLCGIALDVPPDRGSIRLLLHWWTSIRCWFCSHGDQTCSNFCFWFCPASLLASNWFIIGLWLSASCFSWSVFSGLLNTNSGHRVCPKLCSAVEELPLLTVNPDWLHYLSL